MDGLSRHLGAVNITFYSDFPCIETCKKHWETAEVPWKDAFIAAAVVTVLWLLVLALPPHGRRGSILLLLSLAI